MVKLPFSVVMGLLAPPPEVKTVADYRAWIMHRLSGVDETVVEAPRKPVGRPLTYKHPCYTEVEHKALTAALLEHAADYPELWANEKGTAPTGAAKEQPDDPLRFNLNNGVCAVLYDRFGLEDGNGPFLYPPAPLKE